MKYHNVVKGTFMKRINRFIAEVEMDGKLETVHVKNTGRLKELLLSGADVALEQSDNPNRKTGFSLIGVRKDSGWVNIDSQVPNTVVFEAIQAGKIKELGEVRHVEREVTFGKSRFDLFFEGERGEGFIEVKGVTLERDGTALFPDAPTKRGTKHLLEMIDAVKNGYDGTLFFLVQMTGCHSFSPNAEMDEKFVQALNMAREAGVRVLSYDTIVTEQEIIIGDPLDVLLDPSS